MDIQRIDIRKDKRRRRVAFAVGALLAVMVTGVVFARLEPAVPQIERDGTWIDTVKRGPMLREVRGPGLLVPRTIRWIAAETDAQVERIRVKPGTAVSADTVIVELSNPMVMDALTTAQAELASAQASYAARESELESHLLDQRANLAGVEAEYESARLQSEAEKGLVESGIVSRIQYQRSELNAQRLQVRVKIEKERWSMGRQNLRKQLEAERVQIEQLRRTVALRQRQVDSLSVRAGIDGMLQQLQVEEGQQLSAGSNIARVAQGDVLMAQLRIAETQAKDVALGQPVRIDMRTAVIPGKVMRIDPAVHDGTVKIDVELAGTLPGGARPDLSVDGTVEIEHLRDVLHVGRPAFAQTQGPTQLFRLETEHRAIRVPVTLGRASVNQIEVVRGLREGDRVILSDTSRIADHARVELK